MLPYWSRHVLHGDALVYGLVAANWAAGMVVGGLSAGRFNRWAHYGVNAVVGIILGIGHRRLAVGRHSGHPGRCQWRRRGPPLHRHAAGDSRGHSGRTLGLFATLVTVATPLGSLGPG